MNILFLIILLAIVIGVVITFIKFSIKTLFTTLVIIGIIFTLFICFDKPILHKPFNINTVEYLLKIHDDGSLTTTKTITKTQYREIGE